MIFEILRKQHYNLSYFVSQQFKNNKMMHFLLEWDRYCTDCVFGDGRTVHGVQFGKWMVPAVKICFSWYLSWFLAEGKLRPVRFGPILIGEFMVTKGKNATEATKNNEQCRVVFVFNIYLHYAKK